MPKRPTYTKNAQKTYQNKTKEFRKRVLPDEFDKLLDYWKSLIASRK